MTRILVLNSGSSSLKYRLFTDDATVAGGSVERIGESGGGPADHTAALREVLDGLDLRGLTAVGHRVVHGGLRFAEPTLIDDEVVAEITDLVPLAPLHNPANLTGIAVARRLLPHVRQVAVFDTAFHRTLPEAAAAYAIDRRVAQRYGIRRYGFHGTSHAYVSRRTATLLGREYADTFTVSLHLGNGASACAVAGGRSVATSMGMSPLEGLVMGTRSGDLDPTALLVLARSGDFSIDDVDELLNHRSGLLGLSGANDMREVLRRRAAGDEAAGLAFEVYCRRVKSYVGAYYAILGRLDAVTFTAGVGEHAPAVRAAALAGLDRLGIIIDPDRNTAVPDRDAGEAARSPAGPERDARTGTGGVAGGDRVISTPESPVSVCVVRTDEESEIARQTRSLVQELDRDAG